MSKWFGSVTNRIAESCIDPSPVVGMVVTEYCWSDRHPFEIIEVIDDRHIIVRELDHKFISEGGIFGNQDCEYSSNENNRCLKLFKTKEGKWRERIGRNSLGCNVFGLGRAEYYYDPSF